MLTKQSGKNSQTWQFIRTMLFSGAIFIVSVVIILLIIGWTKKESIKKIFIENVQNQINADLHLGAVKLNLLRRFPMATVSFHDVVLTAKNNEQPEELLFEAGNLKLQFNLLDILDKNYTIKQLIIRDGRIKLTAYEASGFDHWFNDALNRQSPPEFQFDIKRLLLYDFGFQYADIKTGQNADLVIHHSRTTGSLSGKRLSFNTKGHLDINTIKSGNFSINEIHSTRFDFRLVTLENGFRIEENSLVSINGQNFDIQGIFAVHDNNPWADASIRTRQINLNSWTHKLPIATRNQVLAYEPSGKADLDLVIYGYLDTASPPRIDCQFRMYDASILFNEHKVTIYNINAKGFYSNGQNNPATTGILTISDFSLRVSDSGNTLSGSINVENFNNPITALHLKGSIRASDLTAWIDNDHISESQGWIDADMKLSGQFNSWEEFFSPKLLDANFEGTLGLRDVRFITKKNLLLPYEEFNGMMRFSNNSVEVQNLSLKVGGSDFFFSGFAKNLLPWMFLPDENIYIETILQSNTIILDELLQQGVSAGDTVYSLKIPDRLRLSIDTRVNKLKFKRFWAKNINGIASLIDQRIQTEDLAFEAMDGNINLTALIDGSKDGSILLTTQAKLDGVDINELFYQTGNFGQSNMTADNIYGTVAASIFFSTLWSTRLAIDWGSMETTASLIIDDGRLKDYQPLMSLGRFIRTENLNNVSFSRLENKIHIKNKVISIPMMEIKSNVLDIELSGEHGFDNQIDYRARVSLSDILSQNRRPARSPQDQYGDIIDDGLGSRTLFLRITGTGQHPVFRYDQESHMDKLRQDLVEEGESLRNILRDEFSFFNRQSAGDSTCTHTDDRQKERQLIKKQEESGFIIEWD